MKHIKYTGALLGLVGLALVFIGNFTDFLSFDTGLVLAFIFWMFGGFLAIFVLEMEDIESIIPPEERMEV